MSRACCSAWCGYPARGLIGALIAVLLMAAGMGCGPPYLDVLVDESGQQIRASEVLAIITNDRDQDGEPDLTEEEQRDSLRALGITDEHLIDALLRLG